MFLAQVVAGVLGLLVGADVIGLFTANHTVIFLGAGTCGVLATRLLRRTTLLWVPLVVPGAARGLAQIWFRTPEGGKLPKGLPREARRVDQAMVVARLALRQKRPNRRPVILERALVRVRQAAKDATIAGSADAVREILRFREPCAGPPDIQKAWAQLLAAAHEGITEGEAAAEPPIPHRAKACRSPRGR
jgi:hypothetical protein